MSFESHIQSYFSLNKNKQFSAYFLILYIHFYIYSLDIQKEYPLPDHDQCGWCRFAIMTVRKMVSIKLQEVFEHVTTSFKATDDQ